MLNVALSRIKRKKADHKIVNEFSTAYCEQKEEKEKPKRAFNRSKAKAVTGVGDETDAYFTEGGVQSNDKNSLGND